MISAPECFYFYKALDLFFDWRKACNGHISSDKKRSVEFYQFIADLLGFECFNAKSVMKFYRFFEVNCTIKLAKGQEKYFS